MSKEKGKLIGSPKIIELFEEARVKMLQAFTPNPRNGCYRRVTPQDTDFYLQWSAKLEPIYLELREAENHHG